MGDYSVVSRQQRITDTDPTGSISPFNHTGVTLHIHTHILNSLQVDNEGITEDKKNQCDMRRYGHHASTGLETTVKSPPVTTR